MSMVSRVLWSPDGLVEVRVSWPGHPYYQNIYIYIYIYIYIGHMLKHLTKSSAMLLIKRDLLQSFNLNLQHFISKHRKTKEKELYTIKCRILSPQIFREKLGPC